MLSANLSLLSECEARAFDQFYTRDDVASRCAGLAVNAAKTLGGDWLWIEPSAGEGAFLDNLPHPRIGLDIASTRTDVMRGDFLKWHPGRTDRRIAVVGNPPFGKNASVARAFIDHAASFADLIAFILPRTFEKPAFRDKLDRRLHLLAEHELDADSYDFVGAPYSVPTVFQLWERRATLRPTMPRTLSHPHFDFVTADRAHFAFQRVGARAGLVSIEGLGKSAQSHYFMRARLAENMLIERLTSIDWGPIKHRTAGNPSIGKGELVAAYAARYE